MRRPAWYFLSFTKHVQLLARHGERSPEVLAGGGEDDEVRREVEVVHDLEGALEGDVSSGQALAAGHRDDEELEADHVTGAVQDK